MFRESATARTLLRAGVVGVLALLATLRSSLGDGIDSAEWVDIIQNTIIAVGGYLGVGAAIPAVEPFFGNKMTPVEVPSPPAIRDNDEPDQAAPYSRT